MSFYAIDRKLFGNGHGIGIPIFDGSIHWLNGRAYTISGFYGCQLSSFDWRKSKVGEVRYAKGRELRPFSSTRKGPRVMNTWRLKELDAIPYDEQAKVIRDFWKDIKNGVNIL